MWSRAKNVGLRYEATGSSAPAAATKSLALENTDHPIKIELRAKRFQDLKGNLSWESNTSNRYPLVLPRD